MSTARVQGLFLFCSALSLIGCGKGPVATNDAATPPSAASVAAPAAAKPTRTIIAITLVTDEKGSRFEPAAVTAKRGDLLRFTLGAGVHNVDFLADSNAGVAGLPAPSEMLQLPQQTFDVPVNFPAGTYYFQCDPHAPLGMTGKLKVE
ncbi:MAG TPA: plastocyanin/azurin family copper-binding protein [Gemmatimonadales bacterium]|jgi:plastocyanin